MTEKGIAYETLRTIAPSKNGSITGAWTKKERPRFVALVEYGPYSKRHADSADS
jgi:hypothetical protein